VASGVDRAPDDDDQADKYVLTDAQLQQAGLSWYELSNWARSGHECRHNLLYWRGQQYLGVGCAAHGYLGGRRSWNVRTPERYVQLVESGRSAEAGGEELDASGRAEESFGLLLRTREGAPLPEEADAEAAALASEGLLERDGHRVRLTVRGRLLANDVTARLLARSARRTTAGTR
jgi:oxygen-independent coproporphyrinogen-3 oxidase